MTDAMTPDRAYQILGLSPSAGEAETRAAFRAAAKRLHPDFAGEDAAGAFREVLEAWRVLAEHGKLTAETPPRRRNDTHRTLFVSARAARLGEIVEVETRIRTVSVPLPRRAETGQRLRLAALGDEGGDLILTLDVAPRPKLAEALRAFMDDYIQPVRHA